MELDEVSVAVGRLQGGMDGVKGELADLKVQVKCLDKKIDLLLKCGESGKSPWWSAPKTLVALAFSMGIVLAVPGAAIAFVLRTGRFPPFTVP